jgi:hypothetical protein
MNDLVPVRPAVAPVAAPPADYAALRIPIPYGSLPPGTLVYAPTTVNHTVIHAAPQIPPPAGVRVLPQAPAPVAPNGPGGRPSRAEAVFWAGAALLGGGAADAGLVGFLYLVRSHAYYLLGAVPVLGMVLVLGAAAVINRQEGSR